MSEKISNKFLIKGGHVIDPASGISRVADVAFANGVVNAIDKDIHETGEEKMLDVSGCYVLPGLIDMHCHLYPALPFHSGMIPSVHPDAHMFQNGVTTAVDAGTCGWQNFPEFYDNIVKRSKTRVLAFINIARNGMMDLSSEQDVNMLNPTVTAEVAKSFPDIAVGIKSAHYGVDIPFDLDHPPWESVERTLQAGESAGLPVMIDMCPVLPQRSYEELLQRLRPGDIHTHIYAQQFPLLDADGRVRDFLWKARERGIRFDTGHGAGSFWFRNAVPCCRQGFLPDTISTDLYMDNIAGPSLGLLHVLSKFLCMGLSLEDAISRVTKVPADILGRDDLGRIRIGGCADLAVLKVCEGAYGFSDSGGARLTGAMRLECVMTIRAGKVVFNPSGIGMPEWTDAPQAYWEAPGIIPY